MSNTASRLITLILLLQRRPNQKAAELAAELGISVRSLHRYMGMLDEMGIPIYSERGPAGGFSLVRGYKMPPLIFSPEEAVALALGANVVGEMWGQLYDEAAHSALVKLENVLPDEQRRQVAWARQSLVAIGLNRMPPEGMAPWLELLRTALREQRTVQLRYQGRGRAGVETRAFDPYALVHGWGWWYTIGYCHLRDDLRQFRVDRIESMELLDATFERPADFDPHAFFRTDAGAGGVLARMRFDAEFADVARRNRAYWERLEEIAGGAVEVVFRAPDLQWATNVAMSYGPIAVVVAPEELRIRVADQARRVCARY
ncbi:MAG: YafY family transcriptional regulator [Anaerolineales bacterium]|nr:YafY family transcriptional regulator [Anaerolineales bacterium]